MKEEDSQPHLPFQERLITEFNIIGYMQPHYLAISKGGTFFRLVVMHKKNKVSKSCSPHNQPHIKLFAVSSALAD
jgi:hypothetical protein